jgi:ABC-type lipoprotein release transport system permease subunit
VSRGGRELLISLLFMAAVALGMAVLIMIMVN